MGKMIEAMTSWNEYIDVIDIVSLRNGANYYENNESSDDEDFLKASKPYVEDSDEDLLDIEFKSKLN